MADLRIAIVLNLDDRATRGLQDAGRKISRSGREMRDSFRLAADMKLAADGIQQFSGLAQKAMRGPIDAFVGFEATMRRVGAVARATPDDLARLTEEAKRLGALQTSPFSAQDVGEGMFTLSQAGLSASEQIAAMEDVLNLAVAATEDLGTTGAITTNVMGAFQLEANQMAAVGDVLAEAFTSADTSLALMGETMKQVGPAAKAAGQDLATTAGLASQLASAGVKGSQAGTALSTILQRLQAPERRGQIALRKLDVQPVDEETGALRPIEDVFSDLGKSLEKFGEARRAEFVGDIFGREASVVSAVNILSSAASRGELQERLSSTREQAEGGGLSREIAEEQAQSADAQIKAFEAAVDTLKIDIGKELTPLLLQLHEELTPIIADIGDWVKENPEAVRAIGKFVGALALVGPPLGTIVLTLSALSSVSKLAAIPIRGLVTAASSLDAAAASATTPTGKLTTALGKAGLVAAVGLAAWEVGKLADRLFNLSDKAAGVNQSQQERVSAGRLANVSEGLNDEQRARRQEILDEIANPETGAADFVLNETGQRFFGVGSAAREEDLRAELAALEKEALEQKKQQDQETIAAINAALGGKDTIFIEDHRVRHERDGKLMDEKELPEGTGEALRSM